MTKPVRIELFGGLRLLTGGGVITHFRTERTAELLAHLAFHRSRTHRRELLSELIWPDSPPAASRHSLSNALSALRVQLEPSGLEPGSVLVTDRSTVGLNPLQVSTDVAEFEQHLRSACETPGPSGARASLQAAVDLYRGELLLGQYHDWIFPEQARLTARYLHALADLTAQLEAAGEVHASIHYATLAVTADPLCEESRARLMRAYAAAGQPLVAHQHYRDLERLLRREMDTTPGPELRELARRLMAAPRQGLRASAPAFEPPPEARPAVPASRELPLEPVGGAVPLDSRFYLARPTDAEFQGAIARGESIVLVKGPRQTGKTSLLARGLESARASTARIALTDLQTLSAGQLSSSDTTLFALAESLADQLDLEVRPREAWDRDRGPGLNFRRYLRRELLAKAPEPVVWGLDEVDRLFPYAFSSEVFALFRSWHNERALDPNGPWSRLTLAMAYATEAHLFISDLTQSPFNVGVRLELEDFSPEQVRELNRRYGEPLAESELGDYVSLVGGHPYLVRRGLYEMARRGIGFGALLHPEDPEVGVFGGQLHRMLRLVAEDTELSQSVRALLRGDASLKEDSFLRLRSAGILSGETALRARFRCELYRKTLARHLS